LEKAALSGLPKAAPAPPAAAFWLVAGALPAQAARKLATPAIAAPLKKPRRLTNSMYSESCSPLSDPSAIAVSFS
jgi:hypothetical protein